MGRYDRLIEALDTLPDARREEIMSVALHLAAERDDEYELTPDEEAELERRLAAPSDLASDAEVEAFFAKLRR